ncbi:MAG TPA: FtsX-like permease family protein [Iamia sp.]|nr:FtsX-like permease family protein [Iamia sp.]
MSPVSPVSRWRVAARLARREVRRHWARSALVVVIIALPVMAAQAAAVAYRSAEATRWADRTGDDLAPEPTYVGADERIGYDPRIGLPEAPPGTERVETGFEISDWTAAVDGRGTGPDDLAAVQAVGYVPDATSLTLVEGELPTTRRQAVISRSLAAATGRGIGDGLVLEASQVEVEVTGIADHSEGVAWVGPPAGADDWVPDTVVRLRASGSQMVTAELFADFWLTPDPDAPPPTAIDDGLARSTRAEVEAAVIGAAAAAMVVGFVAVTCSSAFAIGARRQLRQLGTLSAAGAGPRDLRRAVLLQGTTLGLAGAALATSIVYGLRAFVAGRLAQTDGEWAFFRNESDREMVVVWAPRWVLGIALLGLVAGTAAAAVPALTASRIPVLSALAGRRPATRRPLRSPVLGAATLAAGLVLLSWSTADPSGTESRGVFAAIAVLLTMAGGVALAPGVVAGVAHLAGRAGGTSRLAGRNLARNGMRTAAVVASTAVAIALPLIVSVYGARDTGESHLSAETRAQREAVDDATRQVGQVYVSGGGISGAAVASEVVDEIGPEVVVVEGLFFGPRGETDDGFAVDPEQLRRVTGDDLVADALADGEVVQLAKHGYPRASYGVWTSGNSLPIDTTGRAVRQVRADQVTPLALVLLDQSDVGLMAGPLGEAERSGSTGVTGLLRPTRLTSAEETAVTALRNDPAQPSLTDLRELRPDPDRESVLVQVADLPGTTPSYTGVAVLGAALLALAVIGTSLALAAADGRGDDQVIAAVGAPPHVVRHRRVLEAAMTAAAAAVLALVVGVGAALVVVHNPGIDQRGAPPAFRLPVLEVLGTAGGIVALVGGATWLALAVSAGLRGRRDLFLVDG